MCMSNKHLFGAMGSKLVESKKVQRIWKDTTPMGMIMKNNENKSSSTRPEKKPTPVKSTAPSLSSTKGRTGLNINNYVPIRKY